VVSDSRYKIMKMDGSTILYDAGLVPAPTQDLFDCKRQESDQQKPSGIGRAEVVYFSLGNKKLVLKHYFRGGLVAALVKDCYLGCSVEKSRAFREWRLLKKMRGLGLPVPDAVAARVETKVFCYRADLITEEIENIKTLSDALTSGALSFDIWKKIGVCIKSFHQHDVYHADLNARNILIEEIGRVYLIDFDNSYVRIGEGWKMTNLARLKRSLLKFKGNTTGFNFEESDWSALLKGYGG